MDFQPNRLQSYTRNALLAEIKRVISAHFEGFCPTQRQFNQFSRVHSATIVKEFGSWPVAMQTAGLKYSRSRYSITKNKNDIPKITPDLLLEELKSIAQKHKGNIFQYDDYRRLGGKRARGTFCKYLGGWRKAVASMGLKDGFSRTRLDLQTYVDEDYFAVMQRLWEMLGRQPTVKEMRKYGQISPQSFQQRFGSWMKAVHKFCQDRNQQDSIDFVNDVHEGKPVAQTDKRKHNVIQASTSKLQKRIVKVKKRTPRKPSIRLRFRVLQRDNFTCCACGRSPAKEIGVTLEVDHILAWSRGGESTFENLQTLCGRCNLGKSNE